MRIVILAATALLAVSYSAPAFAQSRTYADCWAAAEKLGGPYGAPHSAYVKRCMAGSKVANAPPKQKTTVGLRHPLADRPDALFVLPEATPGRPRV